MHNTATLQSILSRFTADYQQQHVINPAQYKVIRHLTACRTKSLGGQYVHCDACGFEQHRYHSCRVLTGAGVSPVPEHKLISNLYLEQVYQDEIVM